MFNEADRVSFFFIALSVLTFFVWPSYDLISAEILHQSPKKSSDYVAVTGKLDFSSGISIPSEWLTGKKETPDPSMVISVESVLPQFSQKQNTLLIDVRSHAAFEKFRIPGSMNIPLHALKAKPFLKDKPLILINKGFEYLSLERECLRLQEIGFKQVKILKGGLNAWKANGGPIEGDVFALRNLNRVPPGTYFREMNNEGMLTIDVSDPEGEKSRSFIPASIVIPFKATDHTFPERLKKAIRDHGIPSMTSILIFNGTGAGYERIEKQIRDNGIANIFVLENGLQGYEKFLHEQALIRRPREHATKTVKTCSTCP